MDENKTYSMRSARLWKLFLSTLYISSFTFGGGFVIVTFMKKKFVDELHWIDEEEMLWRIKALLRRARIVDEHKITIGDVELDYDTHTVRRGHDAQVLPPKEFNLLYKLLAYPERTFTRLELLDEIWGMDSESDDKTVNVHINRLRTRFYDWPEFEIQTIRGIGYRAIKKV